MGQTPRHDNRDPVGDKAGKRKVDYPLGSKAHPVITENATIPKGKVDKTGDFGGSHPDADAFPGAYRVAQETSPGNDQDKNLVEVFETLPGVPITTTRVDDDGATVTVTTQRMKVGDIVTDSVIEGSTWVKKWKGEGNAVAATQITETRAKTGNPISRGMPDGESKSVFTETRTMKPLADITPGFTKDATNLWVDTTTMEPIDDVMGYEIVRRIPKGNYYDPDHAILTDEELPFEFPGYLISYGEYLGITMTAPDFFNDSVGVQQASAELVKHIKRKWWVIALTKPEIAFDELAPGNVSINGQDYKVLHDDITRAYGSYVATVPATKPSFTEFFGTVGPLVSGEPPPDPFAAGTPPKWDGTERVVRGGVRDTDHPNRWECETISVVMRSAVPA